MAYLVLARKHRPRSFEAMVGQEHVVRALTNALESQRLHHAYLFTGTRGVGKTTVSRILAKSLNCQGPDGQGGITSRPCGVCDACRDIDAGRFVDYTELDAASNRGVDEVQALLEQAVYKPVQGRFKVFMIDEVHMLTGHAFNAMLKTLEEPPEYLKFVLATTDPQKVPVTVLSRCLQFNLRPMAPETVFEHLSRVLDSEQVSAEPQALRLIARAARGSMRDALSLTDQAIAFGNGELSGEGVRRMLGAADRTQVFRLIEALADGDGRSVVEGVETLRREGFAAASMLEEMTVVLQAMAVRQVVPANASTEPDTDPDAQETARLAGRMPADETQLLYSLCLHGRGELGLAPDEYAALTMVLLRLLAFKPAGETEKKTLKSAPAGEAGEAPPNPQGLAVASRPDTSGRPDGAPDDGRATPAAASAASADEETDAGAPPRAGTRPAQQASPRVPPAPIEESAPVVRAERSERIEGGEGGDPGASPRSADRSARPRPPAASSERPTSDEPPPWLDEGDWAEAGGGDEGPAHGRSGTRAPDALASSPKPADRESPPPGTPAPLDPFSAPTPSATPSSRAVQGARLPVVDAPSRNPREDRARPATDAALAAMPVRHQPEPGLRDRPSDRAPTALVRTEEGDFWHALVSELAAAERIGALTRELALQSQLVARDADQWLLRIERESLNQPASRDKLQAALAQAGHGVRLAIEIGVVQDSPARRNRAAAEARQQAAEAAIRADPDVQAMMRDWDAQIVPGSLKPA